MPMTADQIEYSQTERDKYWLMVKKTLQRIFHEKPDCADALREEISKLPLEEELVIYHDEPLNVAANLAGTRPSKDQVREYLALAAKMGWSSP